MGGSNTGEEATWPSVWYSAWIEHDLYKKWQYFLCCREKFRLSGRSCVRARGLLVGAAWVWGCWWVIEVQREIRNAASESQAVAFSTGRTCLTSGLFFNFTAHCKILLCVHLPYHCFWKARAGRKIAALWAVASSVASQLLHGGENALWSCSGSEEGWVQPGANAKVKPWNFCTYW